MALVVLPGALGGLGLLYSSLPNAAPPASSTLTAYQPALAPLAPSVPARPGVPVLATVAGRVWEVYFVPGQRVRQGQILLKVAQKLLTADQQQLQQQLARQQQAFATLVAQPAPTAELAAAQAQLAATQQKLAATPAQLSFLFVTAPQDGVVATRCVIPGDYLALGAPVATLAPLASTPDDTTLLLSRAY